MEVVITFAKGDKGSDVVVARRVSVIEGLVSEPVSEGVDAEGSLLNEADSKNSGVDKSTPPVAPAKASNNTRKRKGHDQYALDVVLVLPDDDRILVQVGNIGSALGLGVLLKDDPSDVGVEKTLADGIGILVCISIAVMHTMTV